MQNADIMFEVNRIFSNHDYLNESFPLIKPRMKTRNCWDAIKLLTHKGT